MLFPPEGQVYDYCLDDAGIPLPAKEDEEEEALKSRKVWGASESLSCGACSKTDCSILWRFLCNLS